MWPYRDVMTPMPHLDPTAAAWELAWRRERLMAGARPRRRAVARPALRQRVGLAVVHIGLVVAGRLTVTGVTEPRGAVTRP